MDWYRQWFVYDFPQVFPSSIVLSSSPVAWSIKSHRFPSLSGEAARVCVFASKIHWESGEIPTSRRRMQQGVALMVGNMGNSPSDHEIMKYL
jgi:hypothetical protein